MKNVYKNKSDDFSFEAPCAFFDGAQQNNICGCGVHIVMNDKQQFFLSWNGGHGSNNMVEARALTGLLSFCAFMDIQCISIYDDSKSLIDHVNGACLIICPHLFGWLNRIRHFWSIMKQCSIQHIPRSRNEQANLLSKKDPAMEPGSWSLKVSNDEFSYLI